jgi:hypothetical protein
LLVTVVVEVLVEIVPGLAASVKTKNERKNSAITSAAVKTRYAFVAFGELESVTFSSWLNLVTLWYKAERRGRNRRILTAEISWQKSARAKI